MRALNPSRWPPGFLLTAVFYALFALTGLAFAVLLDDSAVLSAAMLGLVVLPVVWFATREHASPTCSSSAIGCPGRRRWPWPSGRPS